MAHLTDLEHKVLRFAIDGRKLDDTRTVFGWRPATYVQRLHLLLDDPRAERVEPFHVRRLRAIRDSRHHARARRAFTASA